jgi:hypothetical protein
MTARGFLLLLLLFLMGAVSVIAWRYLFPGDSLEALATHCAELRLPVHTVVLVPGSEREARFKFLTPVGNRARVPDTDRWLFCHTNPRID